MQPSRHARVDLTIADRLEQLEIDMTAVHEAVGQLADKLNQIEQLINERDADHSAVVQAQIERADSLIERLKQEQPPGEAVESTSEWQEAPVTPSEHGLMS